MSKCVISLMTHSDLYIFISPLVWQHFVSRFANFFVTFFVVPECLADWEKITSNGFLHTDPEMLLHDTHMVRISIPNVKWVKTRDEFGVSYAWEACLKKNNEISSFLRWHISETKHIIEEILEDTSLRSFSCRAQDSPEHPYVFFTPQLCPSFANIRVQANSFEENMKILKIVKFLLFRNKSKTGEWLTTYTSINLYQIFIFLTAS